MIHARSVPGLARALLTAGAFAVTSLATGALAQDGAMPREIPEGFQLPGPPPTGGTPSPSAPGDGATPREIPEGFQLPGPPPTGSSDPGPGAQGNAPAQGAVQRPMDFATVPETGTTDWPCVQRRVPQIEPAQIWAGPDLSAAENVERTSELRALVAEAAARRVAIEDAQEAVRDYLADQPEDQRTAVAAAFFTDLLEQLNRERGEVMGGIESYARKQKAMAEALRKQNEEFALFVRSADATPDEITRRRDELLWRTRIFDERRQSLTYVCEVPVIIERRAFALGRAAQEAL